MKERPILFSAPMVRAILSGRKTQTRRLVKPAAGRQSEWLTSDLIARSPRLTIGRTNPDGIFGAQMDHPRGGPLGFVACPYYGQPGDRLWVRETWRTAKSLDSKSPAVIGEMCKEAGYKNPWAPLAYEADGHQNSEWRGFELGGDAEPGKTRVSIHMPRWASRILLEITAVRVERLQDITPADCVEEGYVSAPMEPYQSEELVALDWYRQLWESLNGPGSWAANPWVWVIEFKRV
jgi:hypothetical protein